MLLINLLQPPTQDEIIGTKTLITIIGGLIMFLQALVGYIFNNHTKSDAERFNKLEAAMGKQTEALAEHNRACTEKIRLDSKLIVEVENLRDSLEDKHEQHVNSLAAVNGELVEMRKSREEQGKILERVSERLSWITKDSPNRLPT